LSSLRVTLGEDTRALLGCFPEARITAVPFAGELGAEVTGVELGPHITMAIQVDPGTLHLLEGTNWDGEAEALARMSGLASDWAAAASSSAAAPS
jgi:hypothetical protein